MRKRVLLAWVFAVVLFVLSLSAPLAAAFSGNGAGTALNPYKIADCEQFASIGDDLSAHYVLVSDIDCSTGGITNGIVGFSGVFDGQNFAISHIQTENDVYSEGYALFATTNGATIKNLSVTDSDIWAYNNGAGVVGYAVNTTIENVHSSVNIVDARNSTGGLVGWAYSGVTISRSSFTGTIQDGNTAVGGLVGALQDGSSITDSYVNATQQGGNSSVGGLAGVVSDSAITRSYVAGEQTHSSGASNFGGLVGSMSGSSLTNSFSNSVLDNNGDPIGGVINSVDTSTVSGTYYNIYTCACSAGTVTGDDFSIGVNDANATPDYFKGNDSDAPLNTWDFDTIWRVNAGALPTLRTASTPADADSDGQASGVESAGPNGGDANGDGTVDSAQANVASFVNGVTGKYVVVETDCDSVQSASVMNESANSTSDGAYDYPLGMLDFSLGCLTNGATATVTLYYYTNDGLEGYSARKYNPPTGEYSTLEGASITEVTLGGKHALKVTYQITDGGELDADGAANGTIVDPVGLAKATEALAESGRAQYVYALASVVLLTAAFVLFRRQAVPHPS